MKRSGRGFTLIELLVVIAIIAMLLAIIVPSLKKAKGHARLLLDRNNLKAMGMAMQIYLNEHKDKFFAYPAPGTKNTLWLPNIGDQIGNIEEVRFCPETRVKKTEVEQDYALVAGGKWGTSAKPWLWDSSPDPAKRYEMGSYGFNGWLYSDANAWVPADKKDCPYKGRAEVRNPNQTPLFLDANWVDAWPDNTNVLPAVSYPTSASGYKYDDGDRTGETTPTSIGRFVMGRHGPQTNVVFLDAHSETVPFEELWTMSWHRESKPKYNPVIPKPLPRPR